MKFKMPIKQIVISGTHNGTFDVQVGCARFAYENPVDLLEAIEEYLEDPETIEKQYNQFMAELSQRELEMGRAMDRPNLNPEPAIRVEPGPSVTGQTSQEMNRLHRRQD